jgi:hypothetical protein
LKEVIEMITTTLYGLKKPEDSDVADLRVFVGDNMDILEAKINGLETDTTTWDEVTEKPTAFLPQLMSVNQRGGAMVGNGLGMSTEYLFVKTASVDGTKINTAGAYNIAIDRTVVDTWYAPATHSHDWTTQITGKPLTFTPPIATTGSLGGIIVGTGLTIDPTGVLSATSTAIPLMDIDTIGGAMVGNGLGMSGNYLFVRTGTGIEIDPAMLNVSIDRDVLDTWYAGIERLDGLSFWRGTQVEYNGIVAKDPNTVYYIVG